MSDVEGDQKSSALSWLAEARHYLSEAVTRGFVGDGARELIVKAQVAIDQADGDLNGYPPKPPTIQELELRHETVEPISGIGSKP